MYKKIVFLLSFVVFFSCSKKNKNISENEAVFVEKPYDTTAIDSFSNGATSVDVAERIRMSSQKYRDSVKQVLLKQETERKQKAAKEALEKERKTEGNAD